MKLSIKGRVPSKKNSRINTRSGRSFPSKKYTEWHEDASWQLFPQKKKMGIDRCQVKLMFYMPDMIRADLTNKAESIMDLLVDIGVITDDRWQVVRPLLLDAELDRDNPRCEITINTI